jgi:hypothetical protein
MGRRAHVDHSEVENSYLLHAAQRLRVVTFLAPVDGVGDASRGDISRLYVDTR